jgi:2-(1,2-epoxy-1,2-dihydrophenyl)acetyl-CoA isomerase
MKAMASTSDDGIEVSDRGAVRTIMLNRPERLNAFDSVMEAAVLEALHAAERDRDVGSVVITGAGRGFCAGHDFKEARSGGDGGDGGGARGVGADATEQNRMMQAVMRLGKPVVGAINGVVAGGGLALALSCDMRIASTDATFQEIHVHRGIVPALESWLLPRTIGLSRAMEMTITGRKVDAATAADWGLVTKVTPPDELMDEAQALAEAAAALPRTAFALTKRAVHLGLQSSLQDTLQYISAARTIGGYSGESSQGARDFLEKSLEKSPEKRS